MKFYTLKHLVWTVCIAILAIIVGYGAACAENKLVLSAEEDGSGLGGHINIRTAIPLGLTIFPERGEARVKVDQYSELLPESAKPLSYTAPGGKFSAQLNYLAPQGNTVSVKVTIFIKDVKGRENQFTGAVKLEPIARGSKDSYSPQSAVRSPQSTSPPPLRIGFPALKDSPCRGKLKLTVPLNREYVDLFDSWGKARVEVRFKGDKEAYLIKNQDVTYKLTNNVLESVVDFVRPQSEVARFTLLLHVNKKDGGGTIFQKEDSISPPAASQKGSCEQPAEEFKLDIINVVTNLDNFYRLTIKLKANQEREIVGILTDPQAGTVQKLPVLGVGPEERRFTVTASLTDNTFLKFTDLKNGKEVGDTLQLKVLHKQETKTAPAAPLSLALMLSVFVALLSLFFVVYLYLRKLNQSVRIQEQNLSELQKRFDSFRLPSGPQDGQSEVLRSFSDTVSRTANEIRTEFEGRYSSIRREIADSAHREIRDSFTRFVGSPQEYDGIKQWMQSRAQKGYWQDDSPSRVVADIPSTEAVLLAVVNECFARQTIIRTDLQVAAVTHGIKAQFFDLRNMAENLQNPYLLDYRFESVASGNWVFADTGDGDFFAIPFNSRALTGSVLTLLKRMFKGTETIYDNPRLQLAWRAARFRRQPSSSNLFRLVDKGFLQIWNGPAPDNISPPPRLSDITRRNAYNLPSAPQSLFAILGILLRSISPDIEKAKGQAPALIGQSNRNSVDSENLSQRFRAALENITEEIKATQKQVSDLQERVAQLKYSTVSTSSKIEGLEARIAKAEKMDSTLKALLSQQHQEQKSPYERTQRSNVCEPYEKTAVADVVDEVEVPVLGHTITLQAIDSNLIGGSRKEVSSTVLKGQDETQGSEPESAETSVKAMLPADAPKLNKDTPEPASQQIDESPRQQIGMKTELIRLPDPWEVWKKVLTEVLESVGDSLVQLSVRDYVRRLQLLLDSLHHHGQQANIVHLSQESDGFLFHEVKIDSTGNIFCVQCGGSLTGNLPFQLTVTTGESNASQKILLPPGRIAVTEYYSGYQMLIEGVTPSGVIDVTPSQQPAELRQVSEDCNRRYTVVRKMICRT